MLLVFVCLTHHGRYRHGGCGSGYPDTEPTSEQKTGSDHKKPGSGSDTKETTGSDHKNPDPDPTLPKQPDHT